MRVSLFLISALALTLYFPAVAQDQAAIPNGDLWIQWDQATRNQYILCFTFGYIEGLFHAKSLVTGNTQTLHDFTNKTSRVSVAQISTALDELYANFENRVIVITKAISLANALATGVYNRTTYTQMIDLWREKSLKGEYY